MKCPYCMKPGEMHLVHIYGLGYSYIPCQICRGTGVIDSEFGRRMKVGASLREVRLADYRSIREEAKRLNVTPSTLARVEAGKLYAPEDYELWNLLTGEALESKS